MKRKNCSLAIIKLLFGWITMLRFCFRWLDRAVMVQIAEQRTINEQATKIIFFSIVVGQILVEWMRDLTNWFTENFCLLQLRIPPVFSQPLWHVHTWKPSATIPRFLGFSFSLPSSSCLRRDRCGRREHIYPMKLRVTHSRREKNANFRFKEVLKEPPSADQNAVPNSFTYVAARNIFIHRIAHARNFPT